MVTLLGQHALITGANRGIGAEIAKSLAANGATVTLLGRDADRLAALAGQLPQSAGTVVADVAREDEVERAFRAAANRSGPISVLVNNAGQAESSPVSRTSLELWERMLAVNLTGTFLCSRAALPGMLSAGHGRIINISSTAGLRGYAYVGAYAASKHGVIGLTRSLALEVAAKGITVNAICPGYTETDLLRTSIENVVAKTGRSADEAKASFAAGNPQRRLVHPSDIASAVLWLCSEGASAVTGQSISISGGEVMA